MEGKARQGNSIGNSIGKGMEQNKKEHNKTEGKGKDGNRKDGKAAREEYLFRSDKFLIGKLLWKLDQ